MRPNARPEDAYPLFGGVEDKCELFYETIDTNSGWYRFHRYQPFPFRIPYPTRLDQIWLSIFQKRGIYMATQTTAASSPKQLNMTIDGHKVTLSFSQEYNPAVSKLVRNTLLDAFIRKNEICNEPTSV